MDYISIKDFASKVGVSPQAIYQRLDKDLQGYVKVIKGKKTLDIKALELFSDKQIEQDIVKTLQDTLTVLSNQLLEKDKQIAFLQGQLQAAQVLHAGTMQKQLTDGKPEKPGFWDRFKKKKDGHE